MSYNLLPCFQKNVFLTYLSTKTFSLWFDYFSINIVLPSILSILKISFLVSLIHKSFLFLVAFVNSLNSILLSLKLFIKDFNFINFLNILCESLYLILILNLVFFGIMSIILFLSIIKVLLNYGLFMFFGIYLYVIAVYLILLDLLFFILKLII